jgi:Tfp pilus tip-associated adhesin PilY1
MKRILTTLIACFPLAVCGGAYGGTLSASLTYPATSYESANPPPSIQITFTEAMGSSSKAPTVTSSNIALTDQNGVTYALNGPTWNTTGSSTYTKATFTLVASSIPTQLTYTVNLVSTATALSGDTITCSAASPYYVGQFTEESTQPTITAYTPWPPSANNNTYVTTLSPTITATFNQTIDTTTVTTSTFYVKQSSTTVTPASGTTNYPTCSGPNYTKCTWKPNANLINGDTYTVTLTTGIKDTAQPTENALASGLSYSFTVDTTPPVVASVSPTLSATGVSASTGIIINFTEATSGMNQNTFTTSNITITNGTTSATVPFTSSFNSSTNQLTLTPAGGLDYSTTYTVSLSNATGGVADYAGNLLSCGVLNSATSGQCSWTFTTQAVTAATYNAYPSFMCSNVQPNVLIILDNSASFDEDLNNNAIGSPTCTNANNLATCSRSILARQALINLISQFGNQMRIGLMTYKQNSVSKWYLHNNFYFASFDPRSYCPNPPAACTTYCNTEDPKSGLPGTYTMSANEQTCYNSCVAQNAFFQSNFRDPITTTIGSGTSASPLGSPLDSAYPGAINSVERFDYCSTTYPKTQSYTDANKVTIYYNTPGTFYNPSNAGTMYLYSPNYNTYQYPTNLPSYNECTGHTSGAAGASNSTSLFQGCSNAGSFAPTPDDEALGFLNYGQFQYWYYTSPTWYASSSPGGGYLNAPIASNNTSNTQKTALLTLLGAYVSSPAFLNDPTDYMSCAATGNPNTCPQIINAGYMAFNGTLQNAMQYFNGTFTQGSTTYSSPIQYPCQKNYIIYITDGSPTVDQNGTINTASNLMPSVLTTMAGLRCPANPVAGTNCQVNVTLNGTIVKFDVQTYVLGMGIVPIDLANINSMAVAGGTAVNGQAYLGNNVTAFNNAIVTIFNNILANVASGTAASILNNSQGSGSNLLQAMFYPMDLFTNNNTPAYWIGEMQNLWYYLDSQLQNPTIREDTNHDNTLELNSDNILNYSYNASQGKTLVNVYTDTNGTNTASATPLTTGEQPNQVNSLWSAGALLWQRNLTTDPRTVYTGYNSTLGQTPQLFSSAASANFVNSPTVWSLLQIPSGTAAYQQAKATTLVNYILGTDQPTDSDGTQYRSRQVTWWGTPSTGCGLSDSEGCTREWKLGDIVSSTPKLVSTLPLASYHLTAPQGYNDTTYYSFITSSTYNRGMAFVGANDGMLHAFKLGILQEITGTYNKAQINDPLTGLVATSATKLGHEEWAFIPQNALPYLDYYTQPGYNHLFYVDRTPTIVDASIGVPVGCTGDYSSCTRSATTWRTVLIGGMGMGGANRTSTQTCNSETNGIPNCIISPLANGGLSSYFALDVTNPESPLFLWEFNASASGALGATTTGPVVVRESYRNASNSVLPYANGKWYAVFASGPTGPINTAYHEFLGQSDQNLKIFIVDLATGALVSTIDSGLTNAFASSLATNSIDTDKWNPSANGVNNSGVFYSDDAIYIGYTQLNPATGLWNQGGVLRLTTSDMPYGTNPSTGNPAWTLSTLISGTGPVTTAITKLQDTTNHTLWIYFGTGRFYYNGDDPSATPEQIYGLKEPCYSTYNNGINTTAGGTQDHMDSTCIAPVKNTVLNPIVDQSGFSSAPATSLSASASGWSITLDSADANDMTERIISDPTANSNGTVFFTSFKPNPSPCAYGGNSYIWALGYNTGAAPPASAMQGQALVQVSTGVLQQVSLASAFTTTGSTRYNGRRLASPIAGAPPTSQGIALVALPQPARKIMHYQEN